MEKNLNSNTESQQEKEANFEQYWTDMTSHPDRPFDYEGTYPKHEFLDYLVQQKGVLLHGSNNIELEVLEPQQANDTAKEFGNQNAVYAVDDPILPLFYAIKDQKLFQGRAVSGFDEIESEQGIEKEYHFKVDRELLEQQPWSNGVVYVLPRDSFEEGITDEGEHLGEWASIKSVKPIARLHVTIEDFPYLSHIEPIKEA